MRIVNITSKKVVFTSKEVLSILSTHEGPDKIVNFLHRNSSGDILRESLIEHVRSKKPELLKGVEEYEIEVERICISGDDIDEKYKYSWELCLSPAE